jgi:thymidylate synthase
MRKPGNLPGLVMNPDKKDIFDFTFDDFELTNYVSQAHIAAPIAV